MRETRRARWYAGLRPYVLAVDVAGLLVVLACLPSLVQQPPQLWQVLGVVGLCVLAEAPLVERRVGHNVEAFTFAEVFLLLGLVVLPGPALAVLCASSVLAFHLACRMVPVKALFNAAACGVGAGMAAAVNSVVAGGSEAGDLRALVGVVLGTLAYHLWNSAAISGAMARAQGVSFLEIYRAGALMRTIIAGGNIAVGLFVLLVGQWNLRALVLLPPVLVALYFLYRGYLRANQERDVWQQLEVATRELNLLEEPQIAAAALRRAQQLFRTDSVELVLSQPGRGTRLYGLGEDGGVRVCDAPEGELVARSATYVTVEEPGAPDAVVTCLVAPLEGPKGRIGVLRLVFDGPVRFRARERQVLSTFAHAVATTVLNAALYDDVRTEAARQAHEASHDHLTGLGNRARLTVRTRTAVEGGDGTTALLLLDLDHFKEINDTLGHAAGDVLLTELGRRLGTLVRPGCYVARLGGDEFAVLLTGLVSPEQAEPVAEAVLRLLTEPVEFEGLRLTVEGSLGVACHPHDGATAEELFRRADVAMYQAKSSRGSWLRYSAERDDSSVHRQALVAELRAAVDNGQLVVHYQPQVDLETGLVVGAEALCRWEHPTRGLLAPSEFVGAAEHSGLVRPFTLAVLDQAIAECVTWQDLGRPMSLAVNLSARSLLDRSLPDDVAALLARHGLPPDRLVLEITETTATSELEVVEEVLARLRRLGVEISVDDFGTGYSSLAFLQRTAVNELKVDRSFVAGMLRSENDLALVRATVQLAHSLGARSVAEGVEDPALAEALRDLGCDVAQGYWFSRPVPAGALRPLLMTRLGRDGLPARVPLARAETADLRLLTVVAEPA